MAVVVVVAPMDLLILNTGNLLKVGTDKNNDSFMNKIECPYFFLRSVLFSSVLQEFSQILWRNIPVNSNGWSYLPISGKSANRRVITFSPTHSIFKYSVVRRQIAIGSGLLLFYLH
jgi:hypothetical protein